uniref:Serine/threonine-protein phosphatase 4 regulatory subunit 3-like central domain-containing protein n=1 Tax=Ditylenchus dipsaci TaxID=166011 RepID=A0A915CWL2_9BILA
MKHSSAEITPCSSNDISESTVISESCEEEATEPSPLPDDEEGEKPKTALDEIEFIRDAHNRVKLYVLCDQRVWDDRGTGHVACVPSPEHAGSFCIIVRLEATEKNVLESRIVVDTIYQKQQGTLIVWSESDTCDLALSFQEKAGCTEIWDKICRIQGKDPDAEEDNDGEEQEPSDSSTSGVSTSMCATSVSLPPCNLQHLNEIEAMLSNSMFTTTQREKMASSIQQNGYIEKLCELFTMCEDLDNMECLRLFYSIAKNLFLLNSNALLNDLLDEKYFRDIVGMLEYDPSFAEPRKHREFLWNKSKFREVLPIGSDELKGKIHQTYRVQYVQDVCLPAPSLFEENLLTVLTSHLFFNRAEIVNSLLNDKELMKHLFEELRDPSISAMRQRDLTRFLKEFCSFAHSLQPSGPQGRDQFFKALMANDVLATIDPCITSTLSSTRAATVELLTMIVDFSPQIFRDYLVKQFRVIPETRNDDLLINKLINHMLSDKDPEQTAANQMSQALRILLDPESIVAKGDKTDFLPMFYKRAMYSLCKPITENAKDDAPIRDDYYTANRLALVVDLFCFFVEHHNYSMRTYTVQRNLLKSVLVYLKSRHHFLALSALRMCRRILGLKDELYFRYIRDKKVLDQIVECFIQNGPRYNLLNSALIEFFEFIRTEEFRPLMEYVVENYWDTFGKINYVRTFSLMKTRVDQYEFSKNIKDEERLARRKEAPFEDSPPATNLQWIKEKECDNDELFFAKDDDDNWYKSGADGCKKETNGSTDGSNPFLNKPNSEGDSENIPQRKSGVEPLFPSLGRKRKANDDDGMGSVFGGNITPPISSAPTNRISKIVIRMGQQPQMQQQHLQTLAQRLSRSVGSTTTKAEEEEEQVVSSSSSPPKSTSPPTSSTSSPTRPTTVAAPSVSTTTLLSNEKKLVNPIMLKRGISLVDYDESDDSDEENNEETKTDEKEKLKSPSPNNISIGS